jgi:hypothetical protein
VDGQVGEVEGFRGLLRGAAWRLSRISSSHKPQLTYRRLT